MLELIGGTAGQEAKPPHVDAENRHFVAIEHPGSAQQRAVTAERQERVQLIGRPGVEAIVSEARRQIRLEAQLEIQARRELVERLERRGELRITGVADDTQPDRSSRLSHPASASDSSIARTRSAIPS